MTVKQIKTALNKLKKTNELTVKGQAQYSVITVNNWYKWQTEDIQKDISEANKGQGEGKQRATNKNEKNIRIKEIYT